MISATRTRVCVEQVIDREGDLWRRYNDASGDTFELIVVGSTMERASLEQTFGPLVRVEDL